MNDYPEPILTDEDVDVFIEWLSQKKIIGTKAIELVVKTLEGLRNDRIMLRKKLDNPNV